MKEYWIWLRTKSSPTEDQIFSLFNKGKKLGFYYLDHYGKKSLNDNEIKSLLKTKHHVEAHLDKDRYISIYGGENLSLEADFLHTLWRKNPDDITPDCVFIGRLMFELSKDFLVTWFSIRSFVTYFEFDEDAIKHYNNDVGQFKIPNSISCIFLWIGNPEPIKTWENAWEIANAADGLGYKWFDYYLNKELDVDMATSEISDSLAGDFKRTDIFLEADGFRSTMIFNRSLVTLVPHEPYKMKTVEGETAIDLAFYIGILFDLAPHGIDEMISNIEV